MSAIAPLLAQKGYDNFKVAVYSRAYEVEKMDDLKWLDSIWSDIERQVHVDKIYLETHRDLLIVKSETLEKVKKYFHDKGIQTSGGITYTVYEPNRFETFCYTNPEHRQKVQEIMEHSARHFDEVILDDFFFTNCKCELCVKAKGDKSWTNYRMDLMVEAAQSLILKPAKKVNPKVEVVIKYPNWYNHFQGLGFDLEREPALFDGLYTGTETRDATFSAQHLQPYLGYGIFRYFESLKPGGNRGGWVDTGGAINLDRYAEQLWITLFAKAPEITLFDFRQLQRPLEQFRKAPWQGQQTSFDLEEMMKPIGGKAPTTIARSAGYTFEKVDKFIGALGNPTGLKCYRPYHAVGEDFLPNFLGMAGFPVLTVPEFPMEDSVVLLTESAAFDDKIVEKIKGQLMDGKSVVITSGLLKALQGRGIEDIAEIRYTGDKAMIDQFMVGRGGIATSDKKILIPVIKYLTNDSWEVVSAVDGPNGWPLLHEAGYANGSLFVLIIPENHADLYLYPEAALSAIRSIIFNKSKVYLEGPGNISMFLYDNNTLIVESFNDETVKAGIAASRPVTSIRDIISNERIVGKARNASGGWSAPKLVERTIFEFEIKPHSYRVFRIE
jgi:hypothetical protein